MEVRPQRGGGKQISDVERVQMGVSASEHLAP
jgi:hypothetical protein